MKLLTASKDGTVCLSRVVSGGAIALDRNFKGHHGWVC